MGDVNKTKTNSLSLFKDNHSVQEINQGKLPTFDKLRVLNKTFKRKQINFSSDVFAAVVFAYSKLLAPLSALTFLTKTVYCNLVNRVFQGFNKRERS